MNSAETASARQAVLKPHRSSNLRRKQAATARLFNGQTPEDLTSSKSINKLSIK